MSEEAVEGAEGIEKVLGTLLLNIEGAQVLLPDIAVAEIVDYQMTSSPEEDDLPDWFLGQLTWRGLSVPLISLESLNHGAFFTKRPALKIIVVNSLYALKDKAGYWAFVALDTPKMQKLATDALVASEDQPEEGAVTIMIAELLGDEVIVPDVEAVEAAIADLPISP